MPRSNCPTRFQKGFGGEEVWVSSEVELGLHTPLHWERGGGGGGGGGRAWRR